MIETIFVLLIIFQIKHFLADYPLQTEYMLKKFSSNWEQWVPALVVHAGVHAILTFLILLVFAPNLTWLALVDFVVHFTVDRVKASKELGGRWPSTDKKFWWALGADQMAHHLTHYFIIYQILKNVSCVCIW